MKYTFIILTYILLSFYAHAGTFQITSSDVNLDTDGAIHNIVGIDAALESDSGIALEYGFDNGWSLQYGTTDANASVTATLTAENAVLVNSLLEDNPLVGGDSLSLAENYEASILMLKYNTVADLGEKLFYNISFGVGLTKVDFEVIGNFDGGSATFGDSDKTLTCSFGFGLGYRLNENTSLIVNYEFRDAQDGEFKNLGLTDADFDNTSLDIGVKMNF